MNKDIFGAITISYKWNIHKLHSLVIPHDPSSFPYNRMVSIFAFPFEIVDVGEEVSIGE